MGKEVAKSKEEKEFAQCVLVLKAGLECKFGLGSNRRKNLIPTDPLLVYS